MAKVITTIKAILTRIIFSAHSLIAVWQVIQNKKDPIYWALCAPLGLLAMEGVFTLVIKKNQEWRWFCPSVFLYLGSVVPAIWLLELDKVKKRLNIHAQVTGANNSTALETNMKNLNKILGSKFHIPVISVDDDTWTTLIEQFLMLILIIGRWLLPKGDLTRDQLSQLLLVYIGTAADIIEFFDSYKDNKIAKIPLLVYLTLGIWSWSLIQFTIVLSATRSRKTRGGGFSHSDDRSSDCCGDCCCGIDVWGIALNVLLQDAPFLTFRLLIIVHYDIISYMNVFFTCKNSLVILLQLYRLYVVNYEYWKTKREQKRGNQLRARKTATKRKYEDDYEDYLNNKEIYMISSGRYDKKKSSKRVKEDSDDDRAKGKSKKDKYKKRNRKDTGYSTASSQNLYSTKMKDDKPKHRKKDKKLSKHQKDSSSDSEIVVKKKSSKQNKKDDDRRTSRKEKQFDVVAEEESDTTESCSSSTPSMKYEVVHEKKKKKKGKRAASSSSTSSSSSSSS